MRPTAAQDSATVTSTIHDVSDAVRDECAPLATEQVRRLMDDALDALTTAITAGNEGEQITLEQRLRDLSVVYRRRT